MAAIPMEAYTDAVEELAAVEAIWNPFQLIYIQSGGSVVNQWQGLLHSMQLVGVAILVLMVALKFVRAFLDELNHIPALTNILGIAMEMVLVTVFLFNYTWFAEIFPSLFHRMTRAILEAYDASLMDQVLASLQAVGEEKSQETKWFSLNALAASIPNILSTAAAGLALALYWVMSKYQALLYTFWYLIGPVLLPFWLFPPFRGVAERWFASLLGASFMGVVGALMFVLMAKAQWLTKAFSAGVNTSYLTALVFALLTLLLMISIPRLSNSIWEGISTSMTQAMATAGFLGGSATALTLGTAGAATEVAGRTLRTGTGMAGVLHRYGTTAGSGMSHGRRVLDALRNRDSFAQEGRPRTAGEKVLTGAHKVGGVMKDFGHGLLMSQMPSSVRRAEQALSRGGKDRETAKARSREQDAVREYVRSQRGAEVAAGLTFPDRWRLPQRVGQSREEAVAKVGEAYLRSRRVEDMHAGLRREAAALAGEDKAQALRVPANFRLKMRRKQSEEEALRSAAMGLLRSQGLLEGDLKRKLDHEAIRREAVRVLGPDRAQSLSIPAEWTILPKKGQSAQEALEGSTRALMQRQGMIDKKDENAIALRYRYALAKKRKQGSGGNPKGGRRP